MDTFNSLTTQEQQFVFIALELLGDDFDGAWAHLQDEGIYLECDELEEIAQHFHLI